MSRRDARRRAVAVAGLVLAFSACGEIRRTYPAGETAAPASPSLDIAFSFGGRIYLMRPDGRRRLRLTGGRLARRNGGDVQPAWSPDGKTLAFVRTLQTASYDVPSRIYLLDLYEHPRPLTPSLRKVQVSDPAWSPDGRRIAFTRWTQESNTESAIVVAEADGSGERVLRTETLGEQLQQVGQPAWSPDGAHLVYTRTAVDRHYDFRPSLYVMDADGGDDRLLARDASDAAWSADGRRIAFASVRDRNGKWCGSDECNYNGELYVMDGDGTGLHRLTRNRGDDGSPSWSPDGERIVFASDRNFPAGLSDEIYSIGADGSCLTWLTNGSPASLDPAWRSAPGSSSEPGGCGATRRRPLLDMDLRHLRGSERSPAYWLGERYGNLLLGYTQAAPAGHSLRSYTFIYDDCSRYTPRACPHGLQLQVNAVCSGRTNLAVLDQDSYPGSVHVFTGRGLLFIDIGQGDLSVITGGTEVRIFPEAGRGPIRPQLLAAIRALRQVGKPAGPLPSPALPRALLRRLARTKRAYQRFGSIDRAARFLRITGEQVGRRLRLSRALESLPDVRTVSCWRLG